METQTFGPTGLAVAVVGQGTWKIEGTAEVEKTLRRGLDLGMTHLDTAELYEGAEEIVGRVLAGAERERVFLVSKVLPGNGSRRAVVRACERSLKKLGTDHLDVYLQHWNDGSHPISETMAGMRDLVLAGKVRWVGVSNFEVDELEQAVDALGDVPLVCNQVHYNLVDRGIESAVLPWCRQRGIAVVGYSPYAGSAEFAADPTLRAVAGKHGRSVRQVVLRFLSRGEGLFVIPKASSTTHVEENAGGQGFELDPEDLAAIDAAF